MTATASEINSNISTVERATGGIDGIGQVLDFINSYEQDELLAKQNPDFGDAIEIETVKRSLMDAMWALGRFSYDLSLNLPRYRVEKEGLEEEEA